MSVCPFVNLIIFSVSIFEHFVHFEISKYFSLVALLGFNINAKAMTNFKTM